MLDDFEGELFAQIEGYRRDMLDATADLQRRAAQTRELGRVLTGDVIAQGRRVVESIDVRNQNPLFPPLFLTFLEHRDWIARTDAALLRMKKRLLSMSPPTPRVYQQFASYVAAEPIGGLFELNVYDLLDRAFSSAIPQPRLTGSRKRSDVRIEIDGTPVFVEATVLGEGDYWRGIDSMMHAHGLSVYSTSGPGPNAEARRIVSKIGHELQQTAPDAPNILAISFFGSFRREMARDWAFADLFTGAARFGQGNDGTVTDLSNLVRVDSILEFSRSRIRQVHVNPTCAATFRLSDDARDRVLAAFEGVTLMIR